MRLFLSSDEFGDDPQKLVELVGRGGRVALCVNAADYRSRSERQERYDYEAKLLGEFGYEVQELDLREYASPQSVSQFLTDKKLVWTRGGNSFILNDLIHKSGFATVIKDLLNKDRIVYGGYSAGAIVAGITLRGTNHMDKVKLADRVLWDGMGLVNYAIIPHWQTKEWTGAGAKTKAELERLGIAYRVLRDGEVIIVK